MTVRVIQREIADRYGTPALAGPALKQWCLEQEDGPILSRTYYATKQEAEAARDELVERSAWELS